MDKKIPELPVYFASIHNQRIPFQVHLTHPDMTDALFFELKTRNVPVFAHSERLVVTPLLDFVPLWSATTWLNPEFVPVTSVSSAVKALRTLNRDWGLFSIAQHRRARLIQEQLPQKRAGLLPFPNVLPKNPCGCWTPLDESMLLVSSKTTSPFPNGLPHFDEDHRNPPSRAYLKLWEFFTRYPELTPQEGMTVLDMGASPGGWTWALTQLGCRVISVDKAPLHPSLSRHPLVEIRQESAFGLRPQHVGDVDMFFSDIVCYPERLYELVTRFLESGHVSRFVCSVKFQGETDYAMIEKFLSIPGSEIVHLFQNGHEITWFRR